MFAIIGIVVVIGAVIGGYLMEHGHLEVLVQPAELVIIGGAALGTLLVANPLSTVKGVISGLISVLKGSPYSKASYIETLKMMNELFMQARKQGMARLEEDVENPSKSQILSKYPKFLKNHHAVHFVCDTLRMAISGGVAAFDLDQMMEMDMEVHHHHANQPIAALSTVADSLPGLGIVAAVLGVVITMGSLGGPPEEIGHKVAAALVGTFLGILLCYGFRGPLASNMPKLNDAEGDYLRCLRTGVVAFIKGSAPILAVEFARRSVPGDLRPSFKELETACRGGGGGGGRKEVAMSEPQAPIIIIIKKKGGHGGHHGGAWKVAYADFVTAMMALFIVLWLLNTSKPVKEAISAYFNDPRGVGKRQGSSMAGSGESLTLRKDDMVDLKEKLEAVLKQSPDFEKLKDHVQMSVTGDGLRVEMLESEAGMFFQSGSPAPSETGKELILMLAQELGKLPNDLLIEGHTDAKPFGSRTDYTNWELSSDRANSARRLMEANGLRLGQVVQVRGFADRSLRDSNDPNAATNRRISVIVKYLTPPPGSEEETEKEGEKSEAPKAEEHAAPAEHSKEPAKEAEHH